MNEILEIGDADESSDMELARRIGDALCRLYPDHPWVVSFQGRGLVIRHLAIAHAVAQKIGYEGFGALLPREQLGTPKETVRTAMQFGGQLLEAFQLPRGKWDGREPICPDWKHKQDRNFH